MKKIFKTFVLSVFMLFLAGVCEASQLTFAHLSDIHIPGLPQDNSDAPTVQELFLKDAIWDINKNPDIDFVMFTGDMLNSPDSGLLEYIMNICSGINKRWYYTIGNHDYVTWGFMPQKDILGIVKKIDPWYNFDSTNYSFQPKKGFTVIGLNPFHSREDGNEGAYISEEQKEFIKSVLDERKKDVILIFLHTPIMPPIDMQDHELANKDEIIELLNEYKQPIAVFAGHYHATKVIQDGNVLHVATPSLGYSQQYRIVNVKKKPRKVVFNLVYKETNLDEFRFDGSRYQGEEEDKNGVYKLKKSLFK